MIGVSRKRFHLAKISKLSLSLHKLSLNSHELRLSLYVLKLSLKFLRGFVKADSSHNNIL